jgi:actin-related protein
VIGEEAISKKGIFSLKYPIERGIIQNFDEMEKILHHMYYNSLRTAPEESPLFMGEEFGNSPVNREKLTQIIFETFNVPALFLEQSSMFSLYASGRTTGTVLNMGGSKNDACCIYDGNLLPKGEISHLAGREVTDEFVRLLVDSKQRLDHFPSNIVKEKFCFISPNICKQEILLKEYELPDGNVILGKERYLAPEILFNTSNVGGELSIQELVSKCIQSKDDDLKDEFYNNIVLSGGGSLFEGLPERLFDELMKYHSNKINVIAPPERKYSHWIGASLFGMLASSEEAWFTLDQYNECGPTIIHSRFFNNIQSSHVCRPQSEFSKNLTKMRNKLSDISFKSE